MDQYSGSQKNGKSSFQGFTKSAQKQDESFHQNGLVDKATDLLSQNEDHQEGRVTKAIENQTSKIPSAAYLALAVGSMALSAGLATFSKRKDMANFVGLWAPSFLMLGLYNKIVKTHGSDSQTPA